MKTILTRNVTPGKQGARIRADRYDAYKKAILRATPKAKQGITLKELRARLADHPLEGGVTWYMMTVKLDLEARGLLERVPGARPQHIRRTR